MKKTSLGLIAAIFMALIPATPSLAADLPTFTASKTSVAPGQTVRITATPGTRDFLSPFGADNMQNMCAQTYPDSVDTSHAGEDNFSLGGTFSQDEGSYTAREYPGAPVVTNGSNIQYATAGWADFNPRGQSTEFTFNFTIPTDAVVGSAYTLTFKCLSPSFWVRSPVTITDYKVNFVIRAESNNELANTGFSLEPQLYFGVLLLVSGAVLIKRSSSRRGRRSN